MFETVDKIIDALGGTGGVAAALGLSASTVSSWRARGLPSHWWLEIVSMATARGLTGITLETLAAMDAKVPDGDPLEARP